jgi:hypothetical protein
MEIVYIWWFILCINALWTTFIVFTQNYDIYSRIFVSVCAIRGIWPRQYVDRICLFPSWISYPFIGRLLATIGEIAFAYQLSLVTKQPLIFFLGVVAQIFCWGGVITTNYNFHAYEEILWLMIGTICAVSSNTIIAIIGFLYVLFMYFVDIPMYHERHVEDTVSQKSYFSFDGLWDGIKDTMTCKFDDSYNVWKSEMAWMLGYFIIGTRISMYLSRKKYNMKLIHF